MDSADLPRRLEERRTVNYTFSFLEWTLLDFMLCITWAASWQNKQTDNATSEDSNQPGHPPSLIRDLAIRMKKAWVLNYPLSAQRRLWSDWADAQADLSLCWAHCPFCWFYHEVARIGCNTAILFVPKHQSGKKSVASCKLHVHQTLQFRMNFARHFFFFLVFLTKY